MSGCLEIKTRDYVAEEDNVMMAKLWKTAGMILITLLLVGTGWAASGGSDSSLYPGATWSDPYTTMEFVWVPAGSFEMGSQKGSWDEQPVHEVVLSKGFWISRDEVTQAQWEHFMGHNPAKFKGANRPVENVSWNTSMDFVWTLNRDARVAKYALPTEAQWEYAARGGPLCAGCCFAGGEDPKTVAWCEENCGCTTHDVGQKYPNELGIYDMSGNVWEWTRDGRTLYPASKIADPCVECGRYGRVCRGGGWNRDAAYSRVTNRRRVPARFAFDNIGLRLVAVPR